MIPAPLALPALLLFLVPATAVTPASAQDVHRERAERVLATTPLIDGHNDLPWVIRNDSVAPMDVGAYDLRQSTPGHTDLERLREGMLGGQFWSVYVPSNAMDEGPARYQLEQFDLMQQVIDLYPDHFELARTASDVERIFGAGKVASLFGMEGGHVLENSLGALRTYYNLGARYLTLTHSASLDWAEASPDEAEGRGLSAFGEEVVREMNRLGMLVDLSHVSPATMSDALNVSEAPVIFSHSSVRALRDHHRNVPDSILRRLPDNGGVIMITFVPGFLTTRPEATLADVADHIEHARSVAGVDHVGIGGDYDGITTVPVGLEDVSTYPALFTELSRRGWNEEDLRKLAGENVLRVMREAEAAARRLQRERGPSTVLIVDP